MHLDEEVRFRSHSRGYRIITQQYRRGACVMSTEQNKALVRRFYEEVWNKGNYSLADELVDNGGSRYDHETTGPNSAEIQKQAAAGFRRLFPNCQMVIEMMVAEDEWVAARWHIH